MCHVVLPRVFEVEAKSTECAQIGFLSFMNSKVLLILKITHEALFAALMRTHVFEVSSVGCSVV